MSIEIENEGYKGHNRVRKFKLIALCVDDTIKWVEEVTDVFGKNIKVVLEGRIVDFASGFNMETNKYDYKNPVCMEFNTNRDIRITREIDFLEDNFLSVRMSGRNISFYDE